MRKALALCLVVASTPLCAQDVGVQGRWKVTAPTDDTYSGDLIIDVTGRAVASSTNATRSGIWIGYVERADASRVEIVLTDHKTVMRVRCARPSRDVLNCDNASPDGMRVSGMYYMRRSADR